MVEESPDLLFPFFCHKGVMGWCEKMAASCILHNFDQIELESKWVENLISICLTWLYNLRMIPSCHTLEFGTCTWVVSSVKCWYGKTLLSSNVNFFSNCVWKKEWQKLLWQNFAISCLFFHIANICMGNTMKSCIFKIHEKLYFWNTWKVVFLKYMKSCTFKNIFYWF